MKFIVLVLLALATLSLGQTPNPIPLPSLDLNKVKGKWYIVGAYPTDGYIGFDCYTWDVQVIGDNTVNITATIVAGSHTYTGSYIMEVVHNGAIWKESVVGEVDWLAIDPLNAAWATLGSPIQQAANIISRSPTLSDTIIQSQLTLLQTEGYKATKFNTLFIPNNC